LTYLMPREKQWLGLHEWRLDEIYYIVM
jgi:hypothetical protein